MDCNLTGVDTEMRNELINRRTGFYAVQDYGKTWSDDDVSKLRRLFLQGCGISETAVILKRSEQAVIKKLSVEKLFRPIYEKKAPSQKNCCICEKCPCNVKCANKGFCPVSMEKRA